MKLELKRVQYVARLSEETACYVAQLWVDGVHTADVSNDGHGGPDRQMPLKGQTMNDIRELDLRVNAEFPPLDLGKYGMAKATLETECGRLLDEYLGAKDLKKRLAREVVFAQGKEIMHCGLKNKAKLTEGDVARIAACVLGKYHQAKILNGLPLEEALAIYLAPR